MTTVDYKGFEISPAPYQLRDSGEWELRVVIRRHHDARGETLEKPFTGKQTYKSKEEAEAHAIKLGKQIVDGHYPDFSIDDLR